MSIIIWNQGANAQLEQGYGNGVFNWLSGAADVVVDFATANWTLSDGPMHYTLSEERAHWTTVDSPAHWSFEK